MKCCLCEGTALRHAGRRFFCKDHLAEAWQACADEKRNIESEAAVLSPDEVARRRFARAERNGWEAR